jgi:hypothetical protein
MKNLTNFVMEDFKLVFQQKSIMQAMTGHGYSTTSSAKVRTSSYSSNNGIDSSRPNRHSKS